MDAFRRFLPATLIYAGLVVIVFFLALAGLSYANPMEVIGFALIGLAAGGATSAQGFRLRESGQMLTAVNAMAGASKAQAQAIIANERRLAEYLGRGNG